MRIALGPSVCVAHLCGRLGKGTDSWHMVGAMGEKTPLYGEPGVNRAQARSPPPPHPSLKVHLQKPMDLSLAWELHLHYVDLLERIKIWVIAIDLQRDQVSYLYHTADLGSAYCFLWVWQRHGIHTTPRNRGQGSQKSCRDSQGLGVGGPPNSP